MWEISKILSNQLINKRVTGHLMRIWTVSKGITLTQDLEFVWVETDNAHSLIFDSTVP